MKAKSMAGAILGIVALFVFLVAGTLIAKSRTAPVESAGSTASGETPLPKGWRDARFRKAIWTRFTQAWQKRLSILNQTKKSENLIDADSGLTHDWRIIIASNEFVFRVSLPRIFGEKGRCITASISLRSHLPS